MTSHLYEIADQFRFLSRLLDDAELPKEEVDSALGEIKGQLEEKVENIGKFYLSLQATIAAINTEEDRLLDRRKALENKATWLKDYLLQEMTVAEVDKVKRELVTVSVRVSPPSVNVVKEDDIPQEYRVIIPETWHADKKAISDHFKGTGEIIPGVEIITDRKSIQIR